MSSLANIVRYRLNNLKNLHYKIAVRQLNTAEEDIVIPKRIPRGPTDILRALESTVKRDTTAAHYKFHDDPYLTPMSNLNKRAYAMAQEAGRKAAHWVRERHPDLFQHQEADPPIKMFYPRVTYNENSDVTEEDLNGVIGDGLVLEAVMVYKLCKEKNVEVSKETTQRLLELVCFYNGEETLKEEFIEERWFRQANKGKERHRKTWQDGGFAEELFISIDNPDAAAYSTIIEGMSKYYQIERGFQLFQEAQEKGIVLPIDTFAALIRVANFIMEGYEKRWEFIVDLLNRARLTQQRPNLNLLNSMLEAVSTMGISEHTKKCCLQTLAEFKSLGVEPSLGSWHFILATFCKNRGPTSTILHDIMDEIQGKEFSIKHIRDTHFFLSAMDVCRYHLHDRDLAKRVDNLLHFGKNYDLIGDSMKESIYYRNYFILLCETEPLDEFMEHTYHRLVPNVYVPEPAVMEEILNMVSLNSAVHYLPKLWSDITIFDLVNRQALLSSICNTIVKYPPVDEELRQQCSDIVTDVYKLIDGQEEMRTKKLIFTGDLLSDILTIVLRNDDFEYATRIVRKFYTDQHNIQGEAKVEPLQLYVDFCIKEKEPSKAIECIQYSSDCGFPEVEGMASKLNDEMTLSEEHLKKLSSIVGTFALDNKNKNQRAKS